ncbi:MAG: Mur ligase domain-containing protein [bacterium]
MDSIKKTIHFTGIGGSGMSALAQIHAMAGGRATGSDRTFDSGGNLSLRQSLEKLGIRIFPQDGSGISRETDMAVLSTAIEDDNPEVAAARKFSVPVIHRSEFLAEYVKKFRTIAVAGTSGKSTVVAMIFEILEKAGNFPSVITGGNLISLEQKGFFGNAFRGKSDLLVIEADESDGSLLNYNPAVGMILNLTKDHKEIPVIKEIFLKFASGVKTLYINADDPLLSGFPGETRTFGLRSGELHAEDIRLGPSGSEFFLRRVKFSIPVPGRHNVENAVASAAACLGEGISLRDCADALSSFSGVARRFQVLGSAGGVEVVDDYAHNPAKISASLSAAHLKGGRVLTIYQPHGFAPTRLLKKEFIAAFMEGLSQKDMLWMPDIYYAGGTTSKDISSADIIKPLAETGKKAFHMSCRENIPAEVAREARSGDLVLVMGARDPSLGSFARSLLSALQKREKSRRKT